MKEVGGGELVVSGQCSMLNFQCSRNKVGLKNF